MVNLPSGPDFLSVGMQKTGTTWLHDHLSLHPDVWMPPVKELRYLTRSVRRQRIKQQIEKLSDKGLAKVNERRRSRNLRPLEAADIAFMETLSGLRRGAVDYDAYRSLFLAKGDRISGDITPAYSTMSDAEVAAAVAELPGVKVILGIRDPVERFWSLVSGRATKRDDGVLEAAVAKDDWGPVAGILAEEAAEARSDPVRIAERWRRHISDDRFLLTFFDDLKADSDAVRTRIAQFLGIDPGLFPASVPANWDSKADMRRLSLSPFMRERLSVHFADVLRACAATFGGPAANWPAKYGL